MVIDIEGNELNPGDEVYYATQRGVANAQHIIVKAVVLKIHPSGNVSLKQTGEHGFKKHLSTNPERQIVKMQK